MHIRHAAPIHDASYALLPLETILIIGAQYLHKIIKYVAKA